MGEQTSRAALAGKRRGKATSYQAWLCRWERKPSEYFVGKVMSRTAARHQLRVQRQADRAAKLTKEDKFNHATACQIFVIYGGDLEKIKKYPPQQMSKRQRRSLGQDALREAISKKLKADKRPAVSFKELKKMAATYTRKIIKRKQRGI